MLDEFDYKESCCPFDTDFYREKTTAVPEHGKRINTGEMVARIDRLNSRGDKQAVGRVLCEYAENARQLGDIYGELTVVNEMMGHYRMTSQREKALESVERCFELLKLTGTSGSVSAGTILLNAATVMSAFGKSAEAIRCYTDACRCYAAHLPPEDMRYAGLYNNMAAAYADTGEVTHAKAYYLKALEILGAHNDMYSCRLDMAVTYLNLALLCSGTEPESESAGEYAEKATEMLDDCYSEADGYYAHTIEKCAGGFDALGYFVYAETLRERLQDWYRERN